MKKLIKVLPVALALMLIVAIVPIALAASALPGAPQPGLAPSPEVNLLQASLAQTSTTPLTDTETVTDTEAVTDTEDITETESITETEDLTGTETLTDTSALTETETLTQTEDITGTDAVTGTGVAAGTGTTPLAAGCAEDYVVQTGDTLGSIAASFLGRSGAFDAIVQATNAAGSGYQSIEDPNLISVGQTLCIPGSATVSTPAQSTEAVTGTSTVTETGLLGQDILADLPEGKSKLVFENLSAWDLIFDLSGPTIATMIIPPAGKQEFIIEPGTYSYNGHQPGGGFTIAPGNFDIAAGKATGIACFDNSQCEQQQVVQTPQIQTTGTVTQTATTTDTTSSTTGGTGTTQEDQEGTDQEGTGEGDQQGTGQDGQEGTDEGDQEGTDEEDESGTTGP
jgi:LysM repeat protein